VPFVHVRHGRGFALRPLFFAWLSKLLMPSYLLEEALLKPRTPDLKSAFTCPGILFFAQDGKPRKRSPDQLFCLFPYGPGTLWEKAFSKLYSPLSPRSCF
jgi:hypothetical protein